jgi:hypothetical protein
MPDANVPRQMASGGGTPDRSAALCEAGPWIQHVGVWLL